MMAGDVSAGVVGDTLHISEAAFDAGDNQQIEIQSTSRGAIRVRGLGNTLVNGRSYRDFRANNLAIDLGDGNDSVQFSTVNGGVQGLTNVDIDVASDRASFNDEDRVYLNGLYAGNVNVTTGSERDVVQGQSAFLVWLNVSTGSGQDIVWLRNTNSQGVTLNLGSSSDEVFIQDGEFRNTLEIDGGSGNDTVDIVSSQLAGFRFDAGSGRDTATVAAGTSAFWVSLVSGADSNRLEIKDSRVSSSVGLTGSDGNSTIQLRNSSVGGDINVNGGNGSESVLLTDSTVDDIRGSFRGGVDGIMLDRSTVDDVFANLGSNNDWFLMMDSTADWLAPNGSSGSRDEFYFSGRNRIRVFAPSGFEVIDRL